MTNTLPHPTTRNALDDHEMARVDNATIFTSLSPASAREVRIERIISSQPNLVEQARARGFYDHMRGRVSQARAQGGKLEVSYDQGWAKAIRTRAALSGRPWYETEKWRDSGKWTWKIYREGFFQTQGSAPNERRADQDIEVAKAELMDHYGDWGARSTGTAPPHGQGQDQEDEEADSPRM